jgi:hypothetical protein
LPNRVPVILVNGVNTPGVLEKFTSILLKVFKWYGKDLSTAIYCNDKILKFVYPLMAVNIVKPACDKESNLIAKFYWANLSHPR